jgi:hypothetical protein
MKKARRASPDGEGREQNPAPETGIENRKREKTITDTHGRPKGYYVTKIQL